MAHTKAGGVTKGNRDSVAKRLGVKVFSGQTVSPGIIIVRQRGTKFHAGFGVRLGSDDTVYAIRSGKVGYVLKNGDKFVTVS